MIESSKRKTQDKFHTYASSRTLACSILAFLNYYLLRKQPRQIQPQGSQILPCVKPWRRLVLYQSKHRLRNEIRIGFFYGIINDDCSEINSGCDVYSYNDPGWNRTRTPGRMNYPSKCSGRSTSINTAYYSYPSAVVRSAKNVIQQHNQTPSLAEYIRPIPTSSLIWTTLIYLSRTGNCKIF